MSDAYAAAGVDQSAADSAVAALVAVLRTIEPGRAPRAVDLPGHYASVLRLTDELGVAMGTDGVGTKLLVAEQAGRYDTVGIDCIAMNVNDVVCVGAEPVAVQDYLAVQQADAKLLEQIAVGLKRGAQDAGVEIPGGELAVIPELISGAFDLCATAIGVVRLDAIVTGARCMPGDAVIGLPASGLHSNGYTLARRALLEQGGLKLDDRPPELGGQTLADALLEPTVIYVRAALDLLRAADVDVRGLAHITGGGVRNLVRLAAPVGFDLHDPLPVPPIVSLIARHGAVAEAELWEVFNMGCGFTVVVPPDHADAATAIAARRHRGARRIGTVTDEASVVRLPGGIVVA